MDTLAQYLCGMSIFCFFPLTWFPIIGLLYYARLCKAENHHIYAFLRHTNFLQNLFSEKKNGFNLLNFVRADNNPHSRSLFLRSAQYSIAAMYVFCLSCYAGFLLLASSLLLLNVDNGLGIVFTLVIVLSVLASSRLLLFGRNLKKFVKSNY